MYSSEDLAELKKLCEKATPGPWVLGSEADPDLYRGAETIACASGSMVLWDRVLAVLNHHFPYEADSAFIAAARTALPKLIEEVETLREENAKLAEKAWMYDDLCK